MTGKWPGYIAIGILGGLLLVGVYRKCYRDYDLALERYHAASRAQAEHVADLIEGELELVHRNLKVIARLSGLYAGAAVQVQAPDVIGTIYNNMKESARVSALYIQPLPAGAETLLSFGAAARASDGILSSLTVQRNWLERHYAAGKVFADGDIPFIGGPEVMTGDRAGQAAGLVLSVPYFDAAGLVGGLVAAVLHSKVLQDMLPDGDYAIVNTGHNYVRLRDDTGQAGISAAWVRQGLPDPSLLYAQVLPLNIPDPIGKWHIWSGHDDAVFYNSPDVRAIRLYLLSCFGLVFLLLGVSCALWRALLRGNAAVHGRFENAVRAAEESSRAAFDFLIDKMDALDRHAEMAGAAVALLLPEEGQDAASAVQAGNPARAAQDEVEALSRVIRDMRDMLAVGRHGGGTARELFNVRAVLDSVADTVRAAARDKGLDFEMEFRNGEVFPVLAGDPMALGRVLLNLSMNAVQYTKKGFVRIEAGFETIDDSRIMLLMDVVDSGVGISFRQQSSLFDGSGADTITTTAPQGFSSQGFSSVGAADMPAAAPVAGMGGRGMGMVITKTLLDRLGGEINVESTEGVGSTFRVRIPFDTAYPA